MMSIISIILGLACIGISVLVDKAVKDAHETCISFATKVIVPDRDLLEDYAAAEYNNECLATYNDPSLQPDRDTAIKVRRVLENRGYNKYYLDNIAERAGEYAEQLVYDDSRLKEAIKAAEWYGKGQSMMDE